MIIIIALSLYLLNIYMGPYEYYSNIYGAQPDDNGWRGGKTTRRIKVNGKDEGSCNYVDSDGNYQYGITYDGLRCYPLKSERKEKNEKHGKHGKRYLESEEEEEVSKVYEKPREFKKGKSYPICYPNTTNFADMCTKENPKYGVKKITPCNADTSSLECAPGTIGGIDYGKNVIKTPCLNRTDDFDSWCRFYSNGGSAPSGYNVNSIGAKFILEGKLGGCYLNNGKSDPNSASAICDYNYMEQIPKIDTDVFTDCLPITSDFVLNCSSLLGKDYTKSFADEILAYDCNPGFARAKCLTKSEKNEHLKKNKKRIDDITSHKGKKCC